MVVLESAWSSNDIHAVMPTARTVRDADQVQVAVAEKLSWRVGRTAIE